MPIVAQDCFDALQAILSSLRIEQWNGWFAIIDKQLFTRYTNNLQGYLNGGLFCLCTYKK